MKKLICILLIFMFSFSCFAEIDFSKYSVDELYSIIEQANNAIVEKKELKSFTCYPGVYIVGIDIPVGEYIVEGHSGNGMLCSSYLLFKSKNDYDRSSLGGWYILESLHEETYKKITLVQNEILWIKHNNIDFVPYTGIIFN